MTTETPTSDQHDEDVDTTYSANEYDDYEPYRPLSKAAVASFVLAIVALTGLLFPAMLITALLAVFFGFVALQKFRRYPDELTGKPVAVLGLIAGIVLLIGGASLHTYIYATEVPEGYERISFEDLQPRGDGGSISLEDLPHELDGKRVFIKGYIHPGVSGVGEIKTFILVPDMGTCCFGGQPKLSDMVEVTITGDRGLSYSRRKQKLAGTFHVISRPKPQVVGGLEGSYYELEADYVVR